MRHSLPHVLTHAHSLTHTHTHTHTHIHTHTHTHTHTHAHTHLLPIAIQLTRVFHYLPQVFNASTARSWSSEAYNPCPGVMQGAPASRDYEATLALALAFPLPPIQGGFSHELMLKDLSLALRAAAHAGASQS